MIRNIAHSTRTVLHSLLSALLYCAPAVSAEPPADSTAPRPQLAAGLYRVAPFDAARMNEFVPDWLKRGTPVAVPFVAETDELRHAVVSSEPSSGAVAVMLLARPPGTQESLLANTSPQKRPDDVTSAGQGPQPGCQVWRWRVEPTLYAPDLAPASSSGCTSALQYQLTALDASFVLQSSAPLAGQISMNVEQSVALSQFNLVERRAYADILYLPRSVALRVYPSSDAALSHVRPELPAGSYVALRSGSGSESPEWLHVDFLAPDGEATSGWLESLDVIPGRRVNQQQQTHDHRFEVVVSDDDDAGDGYLSWQGILAVHKKTGMKHILPGSGEGRLGPSERLLTVVDANFDGHPDIMIGATDGGAARTAAVPSISSIRRRSASSTTMDCRCSRRCRSTRGERPSPALRATAAAVTLRAPTDLSAENCSKSRIWTSPFLQTESGPSPQAAPCVAKNSSAGSGATGCGCRARITGRLVRGRMNTGSPELRGALGQTRDWPRNHACLATRERCIPKPAIESCIVWPGRR